MVSGLGEGLELRGLGVRVQGFADTCTDRVNRLNPLDLGYAKDRRCGHVGFDNRRLSS